MRNPAGSPIAPSEEKDVVNILLVDDEGRNLDVLESILAAPNYRLVRTQTAQEALMALIDGEFAAIVLDIQMPGTNGIELAHLIKHRKRTQHIPIIFLTGLKDCLLHATEEVCGRTKGLTRHTATWWWNQDVAKLVDEKRSRFKNGRSEGSFRN